MLYKHCILRIATQVHEAVVRGYGAAVADSVISARGGVPPGADVREWTEELVCLRVRVCVCCASCACLCVLTSHACSRKGSYSRMSRHMPKPDVHLLLVQCELAGLLGLPAEEQTRVLSKAARQVTYIHTHAFIPTYIHQYIRDYYSKHGVFMRPYTCPYSF
jgi:hypothetical protein